MTRSNRIPDGYKASGVDVGEADAGLRNIIARITATWPQSGLGAVKLPIGYFANVVDIGGIGVAICTDGVGSKTVVARQMEKYDTIGIDCVAMNVNDAICVGARPISMVDYIAIDRADAAMLDQISVGLTDGARLAGVSISGGEIAQLGGLVHGFDLVGMAIGLVPLDRILVGQDVREGDALIGIASNGIHSNGLTLARRVLCERHSHALTHRFDELDSDLGSELLRPTHIYVKEILDVLARVRSVKALAHITSDGFLNLTRVTSPVGYVIEGLPPPPPIFSIIQRLGQVPASEMYEVYNMGIGFCVVVADGDADETLSILRGHGRQAHRIGHAVADPEKRVRLVKQNLVGQGKKYRPES